MLKTLVQVPVDSIIAVGPKCNRLASYFSYAVHGLKFAAKI